MERDNANIAVPVIVGLAVGIAFVTAFTLVVSSLPPTITIKTTTDGETFYSSPPDVIIVENEDDNTGVFVPDPSGDELNGAVFG